MPDLTQYFPITNPSLIFLLVLVIILLAPIIMGKLRIPHIIGMVLAGVAIGQYGFNILVRDDSFELFGRVGLYYIMFLAALEMDVEGVKKNKGKLSLFGLLTFAVPFTLTFIMSEWLLGYPTIASLLLGCLMASNTLIAYPIVSRYGQQRKPSVALSVGASMLSLLVALVVLAALVASHNGQTGVLFWLWFVAKFVIYCGGLTLLIPKLTRWFLRRYSDAVMQFIFVMAMLFMSAVLSESIGLEGIFGAFLSGLILNRYIPHVSPLMNRIEFIGNALFIPYFLIGVGMLINVRLAFSDTGVLWVALAITLFGTAGKAIAAYLSALLFRLPLNTSGNMMFGLTSAHAAGAIAIIMVGMRLTTPDGSVLVTGEMLNGVVLMILLTCLISTVVTEQAAQQITLRDKEIPQEDTQDDEKMLIPMKYPEYAVRLVNLAIMMRNPKLGRGLVGLSVVYDDVDMRLNQERGQRLLEKVQQYAAAADVKMQTQVRVAANIANGIKHAFKEFRASEIIIGMHMHPEVSASFWGEFHQSLFNGLNRQIIMARLKQPLSTIRRIEVAVPSRAQFEPGFYRWLERVARLSVNLECRTIFHGRTDTLALINQYVRNRHPEMRVEFMQMDHWNEMPRLAATIAEDHLFIVIAARKGTVSYKNALEHLPEEIQQFFSGKNIIIIFPDQHGDPMDEMTFAQPQHQEERSAYLAIKEWVNKKLTRTKN
ncbi:MAG: cation:proton antiporter [Prevotella sp.]|nr:cation:proton antiporter [Bacteroidales bacterium]MCI6308094.1 cation:proton antiporter [Prevotella sp.]MCI6764483.1 cation:proton antiporter [Prevotella sp.]MCI7249696.1 cation:proton antiporter [Prevotella sp.]MCI7283365.1 cation:proton antiporter [Prevotella sp.]